MQNRLVENWLIKAKELSFTIPYAQLLAIKGFRILHISKGGSVEQGKDIIALDKNNEVHCFQLKCGDIGITQWRQYKTEIDELVMLTPQHPSIPKEVESWHSYLVTNGMLNNTSARTIADYSKELAGKGFSALQTILKDELVEDFTNYFGSFFPDNLDDLTEFLELYNQNGDDTLSNEQFKKYFEVYFSKVSKKSKQKKIEAINASVIVCSYLLTNKVAADNHLEVIKAWTLLQATIYHFVQLWSIKEGDFKETEALIFDAIELSYRQLIDDIVANETMLSETSYDLLSEPFMVHKIRCTELLGFISAYLNYHFKRGTEPYLPKEMVEKLVFMSEHKAILGESYVPLILNYILFLTKMGKNVRASSELNGLISGLLSTHGRDNVGTPSPYYSLTESAYIAFELEETPTKESFEGRSYTLWSVVLLLARMGEKELLAHHWRLLSYVSCEELIADDSNDLLLWRCENGVLDDKFPNAEQSFKLLQQQASEDYTKHLPSILQDRQWFIPLLINVMPHRTTKSMVLSI